MFSVLSPAQLMLSEATSGVYLECAASVAVFCICCKSLRLVAAESRSARRPGRASPGCLARQSHSLNTFTVPTQLRISLASTITLYQSSPTVTPMYEHQFNIHYFDTRGLLTTFPCRKYPKHQSTFTIHESINTLLSIGIGNRKQAFEHLSVHLKLRNIDLHGLPFKGALKVCWKLLGQASQSMVEKLCLD